MYIPSSSGIPISTATDFHKLVINYWSLWAGSLALHRAHFPLTIEINFSFSNGFIAKKKLKNKLKSQKTIKLYNYPSKRQNDVTRDPFQRPAIYIHRNLCRFNFYHYRDQRTWKQRLMFDISLTLYASWSWPWLCPPINRLVSLYPVIVTFRPVLQHHHLDGTYLLVSWIQVAPLSLRNKPQNNNNCT